MKRAELVQYLDDYLRIAEIRDHMGRRASRSRAALRTRSSAWSTRILFCVEAALSRALT